MNRRLSTAFIALLVLGALGLPLPASARGVVLNFSDVDISTMVKFISDLTGKNFVMDDRVKGKVSVFSPAKLSPDEAFNLFTSVLELKGFTLVQAGKIYKIIPTPGAKQSGMKILTGKDRGSTNESYVARVISLDRISSQEAVTFLQPVVSKDGMISSFGPANMLLVVDSSLNIQKILNLVELIDTDQHREKADIIFLKNAGAENLAKTVGEWLRSKDKSGKPAGQTGAGIVLPDTRLNALMVFGNEKDKEDVKSLVALLDVVPPTSSSKINVHYLENADATEVAKVMDLMIKGSAALPGQPAQVAAPQQSPFESGKITITPDKATNSLVILASPTDYQNLVQVIQKLDKRRRQVFVQAMIAEVSLDKLKELGVKWGVIGGAADRNAAVVGAYDPQNTLTQILSAVTSFGQAGFAIPELAGRPANFAVALNALERNGAVNVLSTPTIMTSDNKEAEMVVAENVPLLTQSNVVTGGIAQQSVERKDIGITLKITPQISEGQYVKLDIYQEISAVKENKGDAKDLVFTKRSAKTSVVVKDKDSVVIGGLIQDQDQISLNKVPLLGDIPILGYLFKTKSTRRQKTNLMIILTPHIVRGSEEMSEITDSHKKTFGAASRSNHSLDLEEALKTNK